MVALPTSSTPSQARVRLLRVNRSSTGSLVKAGLGMTALWMSRHEVTASGPSGTMRSLTGANLPATKPGHRPSQPTSSQKDARSCREEDCRRTGNVVTLDPLAEGSLGAPVRPGCCYTKRMH